MVEYSHSKNKGVHVTMAIIRICLKCGFKMPDEKHKCQICKNTKEFVRIDETKEEKIAEILESIKMKNSNEQHEAEMEAMKPESKKERIKRMKKEGTAFCPKCGSTSLAPAKKGFGIGKALVGATVGTLVAGPFGVFGATAGNMGAKKIRVTCMNCGHTFWAGKQ